MHANPIIHIGALSTNILANPDAALVPPKHKYETTLDKHVNQPILTRLVSYYTDNIEAKPNTKESEIASRACLSLSLIFTDILPSHRLQLHSSTEKVSKDVRKQRLHENRPLTTCTQYVKCLISDSNPYATKSLCKLMLGAQDFNLISELLKKSPSTFPLLKTLLSIKLSASTSDVSAARLLLRSNSSSRKKGSQSQQITDDILNESGHKSKVALNQGSIINDLCQIYFKGLEYSVINKLEHGVMSCVQGIGKFVGYVNADAEKKKKMSSVC
ncbi:hypothetical protein TrVE_jg8182 [Triparma verrucosa]|uniref:Nucleolar complex-associated protein 3 N-terminal domain-containing protein n=1 Tax=Triparma verrucosa TaxID=1606542 RepID=A0A9W7CA90_9STRA|nr:hypothetical protein TrVE_jg8182 [Triparma verrucosa]